MESFIYTAGWSQHHQPSSRPSSGRALGHIRSLSSVASSTTQSTPSSPVPQKTRLPLKSPSTSQLPTISLSATNSTVTVGGEMSTLPDPRSRSRSPVNDESESSPKHHPDLDGEVATLSTKLINAINYQTTLDDTLLATRHELSAAKDTIRDLEAQNASMRDTIRGDVWVRRSTLDAEKKTMQLEKRSMQAQLSAETDKRLDTEKEKRKIEQELENLTTALFEEANKMVIAAKEEAQTQHDTLQRKIDQLKTQLVDSESLLKSQQEQLSELKMVMESMASEHDDQTYGTAPPSPAIGKFEQEHDERAASNSHGPEPTSPSVDGFSPCPPTSLQHLIHPVLRTDLNAFDDFTNLARLSHNKQSPSRVSSGSLGGFSGLALGLGGSTSSAHPSNASTTSLSASTQADRSAPQSPNTPASTASTGSTGNPIPSLKETRFYKRALIEDIEPTLRLDLAPGLSWLARRTVLSSIAEGSLVVEPIPASATYIAIAKPQLNPCSLCGESRKDPEYLRNHRFRTSEAESAQRYPLCNYCLNRVRSTCDYLGFLRVVKDGHWRAEDEDPEKAAWEESVKLRDQMFWARIGGGVVPVAHAAAPLDGAVEQGEEEEAARHESESSKDVPHESCSMSEKKLKCSTPENLSHEDISKTFAPHTPPEQTEGGRPLRITVESADSHSSSDSASTKRLA
ncbi:rab guanine nucleotide exchange factor S2 [Conoideocrella luteorostrata]|uniref:Rab guanine nucleotide exchange factor S2 n=1 Tax=Conoideocrella luteorostrata TaxID=1105319 RepID=A0AAJ0G231_9HYPO|nr:rab guanine nucleotide exchange factor S2 [Conoideocrella luteorostrata]